MFNSNQTFKFFIFQRPTSYMFMLSGILFGNVLICSFTFIPISLEYIFYNIISAYTGILALYILTFFIMSSIIERKKPTKT